MNEILFRAEVSLRRLHRSMAEQHLDLLKFAAGRPAQLRASASQIVRRDTWDADFSRLQPEHLPDDLFAQALAGDGARAVYGTEYVTSGDAGRRCPCVDRHFHPRRHRRCPNASVLSHKIDNAPSPIALLDMRERERRHF